MKTYTLLSEDRSFAFSAENPTGTRGGGSRGGDCTKLSPTVTVRAGESFTRCPGRCMTSGAVTWFFAAGY